MSHLGEPSSPKRELQVLALIHAHTLCTRNPTHSQNIPIHFDNLTPSEQHNLDALETHNPKIANSSTLKHRIPIMFMQLGINPNQTVPIHPNPQFTTWLTRKSMAENHQIHTIRTDYNITSSAPLTLKFWLSSELLGASKTTNSTLLCLSSNWVPKSPSTVNTLPFVLSIRATVQLYQKPSISPQFSLLYEALMWLNKKDEN